MPTYSNKTLPISNEHSIIEFKNVYAGYGRIPVLNNINFTLDKGSFLYIIGPNGSGKSTLIKLLVDILSPLKGKITINTDKIGYLPQFTSQKHDFPISVREAIYTGFKKQKLFLSKEDNELIKKWLKRMEISGLEQQLMSELSGGQQQRVFLIRALIANPELLILDEPTSALDTRFKANFYRLLQELNDKGTTIIFVTHDLQESVKTQQFIMRIEQRITFFGMFEDYKESLGGE